MNQRVTVIGTGRMGSALASALFNKGFATTVWNRTAAKTEPLARLGLRVASSILEAAREADVVIVNINNYDSTLQLLQQPNIESALRGKILVQLTTGTPGEAREMEFWAQRCGTQYFDGCCRHCFVTSALFGFLHGYIICEAENLPQLPSADRPRVISGRADPRADN